MFSKKSYGKINLSLEVVNKRPDNYHEIDTIMSYIDLYDEITFTKAPGCDLILESSLKEFPVDKTNLIYKAWEILKEFSSESTGIKISVKKNIPLAAGLAGGTSNGCTTMKALNEIWNLRFSNERLIELAKPLGADSTFFFYDGLVRARGIGDKIQELPKFDNYPLILINIGKPISSKDVYENIKNYSKGRVEKIVKKIEDFSYYKDNAFNSMEEVSFKTYPELKEIKNLLKNLGADLALMSGSGPTIFGIWKDEKIRDFAYEKIKNSFKYVIKSQLI